LLFGGTIGNLGHIGEEVLLSLLPPNYLLLLGEMLQLGKEFLTGVNVASSIQLKLDSPNLTFDMTKDVGIPEGESLHAIG